MKPQEIREGIDKMIGGLIIYLAKSDGELNLDLMGTYSYLELLNFEKGSKCKCDFKE